MLPQFSSYRVLRVIVVALMAVFCSSYRANAQTITTSTAVSGTYPQANFNIITQWNFNTNQSTVTGSPSIATIGSGIINAIGSTSGNITASGSAGNAGPNNTTTNGTSLQITNFTGNSGVGQGISFTNISTVGSTSTVVVQFDISAINKFSPATLEFEYTTNGGSSYTPFAGNDITFTASNETGTPNMHVTVDFFNVAGVAGNSNFGFELVSVGTTAIGGGSTNSTSGFYLDSVTVSTTPEPTTLVLAGLVAGTGFGGYGWRRFFRKDGTMTI